MFRKRANKIYFLVLNSSNPIIFKQDFFNQITQLSLKFELLDCLPEVISYMKCFILV